MRKASICLLVLFFLSTLAGSLLRGDPQDRPAPKKDAAVEAPPSARQFGEVAIAPDGKRIAWVEELPGDKDALSAGSAIYVADLGASTITPRRITAGDGKASHDEHDIAWSPDGTQLAFLSDKEKEGQLQLYIATVADAKSRKLTSLTGFL